jgi:hypothetical protein
MNESHDSTLSEWHDWYAETLSRLNDLTLDDVVISWLLHVRPNVWCLAWEPYLAEREQWPGLYLQPVLGEWWGPEGLAKSHAQTAMARDLFGRGVVVGEPAFYFGGQIGHLAKLNEVTVLHQRGWQAQRSLRQPIDPGGTPDDEFIWGQVLSRFRLGLSGVSRRKGSTQSKPPPDWDGDPDMWVGPRRRSRAQQASLVRALLVAGLIFDGVTHREAIRTWLAWEMELSGPWSGRDSTKAAWELLQESRRYSGGTPHSKGKWGPKGRSDPLYALREFEQNRMGSDRQIWAAIGIHPESSDSI